MKGRQVPPRPDPSVISITLSGGHTLTVKRDRQAIDALLHSFPKAPIDAASRAAYARWMRKALPLITMDVDAEAVQMVRERYPNAGLPEDDRLVFLCYVVVASPRDALTFTDALLSELRRHG